MPRGTPHTPELRAAVLADLLTGTSLRAVAKKYHLSKATIANWRDDAAISPVVRTEKRLDFGNLVADYLVEALVTVAAQARAVRDPAWLKEQNAHDLAILHGVLVDKAILLFAAQPHDRIDPESDAIDVSATTTPDPA